MLDGKDKFNEVMQHVKEANISLTTLINIASDGTAAMTGKQKGFVPRMKSVAPRFLYVHCIINGEHLVADDIGGYVQQALFTDIHAIYFVT